jgi:nitrile hydratase accessory protein
LSDPEEALRPRRPANGGPVFAEPWHAETLAVVHALIGSGLFSAADWAGALGREVAAATARGDADTDETYYLCVLAALEGLLTETSPDLAVDLDDRAEAWRRAYLATPHGHPVTLEAACRPPLDHDHHHHHPDDPDLAPC